MAAPRRTQKERREGTMAKLVDATIASLAEVGYRATSIAEICTRAGVSQGALFRHFRSRIAIVAAATQAVEQQHLATFAQFTAAGPASESALPGLVAFLRQACRSAESSAWREVMMAARTDFELRVQVAESLRRFELAILDVAQAIGGDVADPDRLGMVVLSLMHMFDIEAVTDVVVQSPEIEDARQAWAVEILKRELGL